VEGGEWRVASEESAREPPRSLGTLRKACVLIE
jgi:hypothetical protein